MLQNLILVWRVLDRVYQQAYVRFYHIFVETGWMFGLPIFKYFLKVRNLVYWAGIFFSLGLCFGGLYSVHTFFSHYVDGVGGGISTPWVGSVGFFDTRYAVLQQAC